MKIRRAFTLVEMLVVIGIIGLLAALILPALSNARRAATNTKCLNNLREIGLAMSQYINDNEQTLPFAVSSNTWDDPGSARGGHERNPKVLSGIPPLSYYLDNYLKYEVRPWLCPATKVLRSEPDKLFRPPQVVVSDGTHAKDAQVDMWLSVGGRCGPGYIFVSTHGWRWYYDNDRTTWDNYGMAYWKARNVSGLRLDQIKTTKQQPSSDIVLLFDYSTQFHSKSGDDVYALVQPNGYTTKATDVIRGKFQSNFLFLDGHVDTKRFAWQGGLLNVLHHPIPQRWDEVGGGDYTQVYPDAYKTEFAD